MKIVDVAEFYAEQGGGVKTYIDHKLRAGSEAGHEMVVVAPGTHDCEEVRPGGGRVVWVASPPVPGDPRYRLHVRQKRIHQFLDRERPDVVEASSVYGGAWIVARWRGRSARRMLVFHQDPVAVFGHSVFDRWLPAPWIDRAFAPTWGYLRNLAGRFDATVVAGDWLRTRLDGFGVPRVHAVPFGIETEPFRQALRDEGLRQGLLERAGMPPTAYLMVGVSRHHPEKRLPTLFEAVQRLNRAFPVAFVLYGDGPQRTRIEALAAETPGAVVAGYTRDRAELARALATADGLLHGSAAETYGLVVAEALCAGTPVVVPDGGGARDLADARVGETYPAGDPEGCAAAVRRLLSRDLDSLRQACRARARDLRSLDDHFRDLFAFYRDGPEPARVWSQRHSVSAPAR
ncbi:MAG TPA: glycosyltransferase [Myxococcales bacterium LLY-WYZ-16_1]|nr:glycosyltransferase [Myxococcales bacterium LLY-WYZ-16_1]